MMQCTLDHADTHNLTTFSELQNSQKLWTTDTNSHTIQYTTIDSTNST